MTANRAHFTLTATLLTAFFFLTPAPASALSVHDWEGFRTEQQRSSYIGDFIEKFTAEIGTKNPALCQAIRDWFVVKPAGQPVSEGLTNLEVEISVIDELAKQGKADLSKIQIEGVIVKVVKDKFRPPQK